MVICGDGRSLVLLSRRQREAARSNGEEVGITHTHARAPGVIVALDCFILVVFSAIRNKALSTQQNQHKNCKARELGKVCVYVYRLGKRRVKRGRCPPPL